ncbi:hypothetical protein CEXT_737181 [Caerostris extrusa]|uniref:Uncharacterized protein n=1 Tax=Caerostris extrusa TaxID=172846 RepID=A0AAV4V2I1_CAEEX|nr:hypothetical protein CEXT_737181 [Caerostris extrusa]
MGYREPRIADKLAREAFEELELLSSHNLMAYGSMVSLLGQRFASHTIPLCLKLKSPFKVSKMIWIKNTLSDGI